MDTQLKEIIINELDELPVHAHQSNGIQHVVRCPYCGDSNNQSHGHFSIRIDPSDPLDPMLYRCLKCDIHGLFTYDVMCDLGLHLGSDAVKSFSKMTYRSCKVNKITAVKTEDFIIPIPDIKRKFTQQKLDYINNRLGTNIRHDEAPKYDLVINFDEFVFTNNIKPSESLSMAYVDFLTKNYVGFISKNKNKITFRLVTSIDAKRYVKLTLNSRNLDPNCFYSIPNTIDIMYTNDINIHIAEGTMDILSVFHNNQHDNLIDNYYYAICGYGYGTIFRNIISMGLNSGIRLHIYADKDKTDFEILRSLKQYEPWFKELYIHRNGYQNPNTHVFEKDFGVTTDKIIDTKKRYK